MGTLRSTDPACQGAVIDGITLGDPATDANGDPIWDDPRIPDGTVEPTAAREEGPLPLPQAEQTGGGLAVEDVADSPVPVRVRIPRPEAVAVDLLDDAEPIVKEV